jgi:predicted MPP superfamily phosphohydrolase
MRKELEIISDIYGLNERIVKKDVIYKKIFELDEIEVEQYISSKGNIVKKYCTITANNKYYKVNSPYEHIRNLITPITVGGFANKVKKR